MRTVVERYGTALAGLALIAFFAISGPNFDSLANILNVLRETSFLAILALGFALALTIAELDLSVADIASLAAVVAGWLVHKQYDPLLAGAAALGGGGALGAFNGVGVTVPHVPSLIVTLGTAPISRSFAFMITP